MKDQILAIALFSSEPEYHTIYSNIARLKVRAEEEGEEDLTAILIEDGEGECEAMSHESISVIIHPLQ